MPQVRFVLLNLVAIFTSDKPNGPNHGFSKGPFLTCFSYNSHEGDWEKIKITLQTFITCLDGFNHCKCNAYSHCVGAGPPTLRIHQSFVYVPIFP